MSEQEYEITYICYKCEHEWREVYTCACDSECPKCEAKNVTPVDFVEVD